MENYYINNDNNMVENPCLTQGEGKKRVRRGEEEAKKRLRRGTEVAWHDESWAKAGLKRGLRLKVLRVAAVLAMMVFVGMNSAWATDYYYFIVNKSGKIVTYAYKSQNSNTNANGDAIPEVIKSVNADNWKLYNFNQIADKDNITITLPTSNGTIDFSDWGNFSLKDDPEPMIKLSDCENVYASGKHYIFVFSDYRENSVPDLENNMYYTMQYRGNSTYAYAYYNGTSVANTHNSSGVTNPENDSKYLWCFKAEVVGGKIDPYDVKIYNALVGDGASDYFVSTTTGNVGDGPEFDANALKPKSAIASPVISSYYIANSYQSGDYNITSNPAKNGAGGNYKGIYFNLWARYQDDGGTQANFTKSGITNNSRFMRDGNRKQNSSIILTQVSKKYIIVDAAGNTIAQALTLSNTLDVPDVIKSPFASYTYYSNQADAIAGTNPINSVTSTTIYVRYTTQSGDFDFNGGTNYFIRTNDNYLYAASSTTLGIESSLSNPPANTRKWKITGNDAYQLTLQNVDNSQYVTYDVSSGEAVPTLSGSGSKFFLHQSNTGQYEVVAITSSGYYSTNYYSMGVANNTLKLYSSSSYAMGDDEVQSVIYSQLICETPVISFDNTTSQVTISCATEGATIHYTTNGDIPTSSSPSTPNPFYISTTTTVKAIATLAGYLDSEREERTIEQVAMPSIQDNGSNAISITCATDGATIYYTTDGSTPTTSSTEYTGPLTENVSGVTIKAFAVMENMINSAVNTGSVMLTCASPVITRNGNNSFIAICDFPSSGVTIYYTTGDGTQPDPTTLSSSVASGGTVTGITLPTTVKAMAVALNYNNSTVTTTTVTQGMGGSGTEADPYTIEYQSDVDDFVNKANTLGEASKFYKVISATPLDFGSAGEITQPFSGNFDGNLQTLTGLTHALFNTVDGGVVRNVILKDVIISGSGNIGAICNEATGASRIYNCGILPTTTVRNAEGEITGFTGSSVGTDGGNCGSLVGLLDGTARVINCFSYANITEGGGTDDYVGGIVGNNNTVSYQDDLKTIVVNCMFYGDINTDDCQNYAPVYGHNIIRNDSVLGINPYDYFREDAAFDNLLPDIDSYKRSWPAKEEYLTRFEYYRSILNSNRQLMAWWVSGNIADTALIAKWVLDPGIAPYPVLKKWGKYPSIINPDPTRTWNPEANNGAGGWQSRASAATYRGKSFGTLNVTVKTGDHPGDAGMTGISVINDKSWPLTITDMDTLNHDYCYYKVQLPYYNEVFGDPNETESHIKRYYGNYTDKVVTGWKITSITGGVEGVTNLTGMDANGMAFDHTFTLDWETGYNFADRYCTEKDKYAVSGRVFAQGGFFYVPEGVTAITIEAYWGKAVYLQNYDNYLDRVNITNNTADGTLKLGDPFVPSGTLPDTYTFSSPSLPVYDSLPAAIRALDQATNTGGVLNKTVYDQAIVLLSNIQWRNENNPVGTNINSNKWYPFTIMSIDRDLDNEPDYCFEFQFRQMWGRPGIQPIRFDFLPVPELGMAVRHNDKQNTIGIFVPQGHFEITETSFMHTTQFEYDAASSGTGSCGTKVLAPVILNGGHFEQIVVRYGPQNTTQYFIMGGHFRMLRFTPGAHTNRQQSAKIRLCAVNAIGGEYPEFYLSGIYRPDIIPTSVTAQGNPHCYTNGGRFGIIAGAGYDKILGSVTFKIDHSIIREFYGGGINGANPIGGSIDVTIDHSIVQDKYCGGPKVGSMESGKTVTTYATGTTFNRFYGGGNGGTSYYRDQGYDGNDNNLPAPTANGWNSFSASGFKKFNPLNTISGLTAQYYDSLGYHALYEFECFVSSNGLDEKPTLRTYTHWAQFGKTSTGNITTFLDDCTVKKSFYGGGNLGNVDGTVTSTLKDCTIMEDVFGGGYSSKIEPFRIHDKSTVVFPEYDKSGVMLHSNGEFTYIQDAGVDRYYTWSNASGHEPLVNPTFQGDDGKWYVYTTESLEGLGEVSSNVELILKGNTTVGHTEGNNLVGGNVYGGGDMSAVNGNATVTIKGNAEVKGNVFGGGNAASVGVVTSGTPGNTTVKLQQGAHVLGNVYGGGNEGPVGGDSKVEIQDEP